MPSKVKPLAFRLPWFRQLFGEAASLKAKAILSHPSIKDAMESERCPICSESFEDCEYFRNLGNE